jgi:hypothetical protein
VEENMKRKTKENKQVQKENKKRIKIRKEERRKMGKVYK